VRTARVALVAGTCITVLSSLAVIAGPAQAAGDTRTVSYDGVTATVPADWPVTDLDGKTGCVRYDQHAVYLGTPTGSNCPAQLVGHVETLQLTGGHAVVTSGAEGLAAAVRRSVAPQSALDVAPAPAARTAIAARTVAGGVFHGLGFDTCAAPSAAAMTAWRTASPYGAANIYIGGTDSACAQANLTATWVAGVSAQGWTLIPTFVGLQAPGTGIGSMFSTNTTTAASQGKVAAINAARIMAGLGMAPHLGNPVYFDMEAYNTTKATTVAAVKAFTNAWTVELHAEGYVSGIYGSSASMMTNLVEWNGTSYNSPDDIWFAHWGTPSTPAHDSYIPDAMWANQQRIHQYQGGHNETYGGVTINIDNDALNGSVGNGAPPPDVTPPKASTTTLPTYTMGRTVLLGWHATDSGSGVASYDVRLADTTRAKHTWVQPTAWTGMTATSLSFTGGLGHSYCFQSRARDEAGNVSAWSAITCTSTPFDDHGFSINKSWKRITGTTFFNGTATITSKLNATATRRGVLLDRVGIIATRCPKCGTIGVYLSGKLLKKINLAGTPAARRVLFTMPGFKRRTATISVKVLTRGRSVQLDGLAISNN
jgi:hypothetical protein